MTGIDSGDFQRLAEEVRQLRREVQEGRDRHAILQCVYNYSRGLDRHDAQLLKSVYHPDAIDNHGKYVSDAAPYADSVIAYLERYMAHMHAIANHVCELDGDTAHAESYVIFVTQTKDGRQVNLGGGRYIDRLERRNGAWKIALRRVAVDWFCGAPGDLDAPIWRQAGYPHGTWDRSDLSRMRPLALSPELAQRHRQDRAAPYGE